MSDQDKNATIDIHEIPDFTEEYTETDVKDSEGNSLPIGKFYGTVTDSKGKWGAYLKAPQGYMATLTLTVKYAIEIEGKPVDRSTGEEFAGRKTTDDVPLPTAGEQDWRRNKRTQVALNLGLISTRGGKTTKDDWFARAIGRDVIFETEKKRAKGENGKLVETDFVNVKMFGGYSPAASAPAASGAVGAAEIEVDPDDI